MEQCSAMCIFSSHMFFVFFPIFFSHIFFKKKFMSFFCIFLSWGIPFHSFIFIIMPHLVNVGLRGPSVICGGLKIIPIRTWNLKRNNDCKYLHNILDTFDELTTPTYNNCTTALKTKSAILKCILEERKKVVVAVVVSLYTYVTLDLQFGAFWRL